MRNYYTTILCNLVDNVYTLEKSTVEEVPSESRAGEEAVCASGGSVGNGGGSCSSNSSFERSEAHDRRREDVLSVQVT